MFAASEVHPTAATVRLQRQGRSHRGVGSLSSVRSLFAYEAEQSYLDELCELEGLEALYVESLKATDLSPIAKLKSLQRLRRLRIFLRSRSRIGGSAFGPAAEAAQHLALDGQMLLQAGMHVARRRPRSTLR